MNEAREIRDRPPLNEIPWIEFLASAPPGRRWITNGMVEPGLYGDRRTLLTPDIVLFCDDEVCNGDRLFECVSGGGTFTTGKTHFQFLRYRCKNCEKKWKTFAVTFVMEPEAANPLAAKLGEWPPFGPRVPGRVITLLGPDRDLFLKGRRAESQGMGVGAFAYYRRVVENQKSRLLEKITLAAERLGCGAESLEQLNSAASESQFTKALEIMTPVIPEALLIKGHNPLQLLHSALSDGLHAKTDSECLEFAKSIRVILTDLADRIAQALRDQAEHDSAVSRLLNPDRMS